MKHLLLQGKRMQAFHEFTCPQLIEACRLSVLKQLLRLELHYPHVPVI